MTVLWINFAIVFVSGFFARYAAKPALAGVTYIKPNKFFVFIAMMSLIIVSALRDNIGDTYFYMHSYSLMTSSLSAIKYSGDFGFNVLQALLHHLSNNPQILIIITGLITNLLIVITLYKFSRMIELSLFVYIAAGMYMVTMNGIRQAFAGAFVFAATKYLINGDWKKFILIDLFASTMHQTALIFIPIYFIVRRKAWTKVTFLLLLGAVGLAAGFNTFSTLIFHAIDSTKYSEYVNVSHGSTLMRAIVTAIPLIIAYFGRDKLRQLWPEIDYIVNLSLLEFVFQIIATKNWIFARFDIYFGLYSLILISWIVLVFREKQRRFVYFGLIVCYLFYFYYEEVMKLNIWYSSHFIHL